MPASLRNYQRMEWTFSEDLYQLGLLCVSLATGEVVTNVTPREIRALELDDQLTEVLIRCLGPRRKRFASAEDALAALEPSSENAPAPTSLKGKRVVFTGKLPVSRVDARTWLAQAGGEFREDVNGQTDVLVVGTPSPLHRSARRGTKLYEVQRRARNGQPVSVIGWPEFTRLTGSKR